MISTHRSVEETVGLDLRSKEKWKSIFTLLLALGNVMLMLAGSQGTAGVEGWK